MTGDDAAAEGMAMVLGEGFAKVARTSPGLASAHTFRIAGRLVRLEVVGPGLAERLAASLDHLRADAPRVSDLTIRVWDGTATGGGRPVGDLRGAFPATVAINDGVAGTARGGRLLGHQSPRSSMVLDLDAGVAHGWFAAAAATPAYALQPALFGWLAAADVLPVLAGLVARGGRGVLLGGPKDSGKSTTALLCARAGLDYLGDDFVALGAPEGAGGGIEGHGLYASARLEADHSRRFPWLAAHRLDAQDGVDKLGFRVTGAARLAERATIVAVVLPRVVDGAGPAALRPVGPGEALLRLAPNSVLQLPFVPQAPVLARLARLVRGVPVRWLDLGGDPEGVPGLIASLLDEAGTPAAG